MIITKYPEEVERNLSKLDKCINDVYEMELQKLESLFPPESSPFTESLLPPEILYKEIEGIKCELYEKTRPFIYTKAQIIERSCPKYIVVGQNDTLQKIVNKMESE